MTATRGKSLLIVDRHPIVRDALTLAARSLVVISRVAAVESFAEARLQVHHEPFDLLLIGHLATGKRECRYLEAMRRQSPPLPVLHFAHDESADSLAAAKSAGLDGFVPRSVALPTLLSAIEALLAGQTHFPASAAAPGLTAQLSPTCPVLLTERRQLVLNHLVRGLTNAEIAEKIGVAEGTVKSHVYHVMRAFDVNSRALLILRAQQMGLG